MIGNLVYIYRDKCLPIAQKFGWPLFIAAIVLKGLDKYAYLEQIPLLQYGQIISFSFTIFAILMVGLSKTTEKPAMIDLSYGCYIYHYPIMLALFSAGVTSNLLFYVTTPVTLVVAACSWYAIEKPALSLKSKWKVKKPETQAS